MLLTRKSNLLIYDDVDIGKAIGSNDISACVTNGIGDAERAEQSASNTIQLLDRHRRDVQTGCEMGTQRIANLRIDTREAKAGVVTSQR